MCNKLVNTCFVTSTNEAAPTTVVVYQIFNKSLRTGLTVYCVFQCNTWAINKGVIYIKHSPSARALCKLCYIKPCNHCKVCSKLKLLLSTVTRNSRNFNLVCYLHCKNEIVKITNLFYTVARNIGNCNLIGCVGCYDSMVINMLLYPFNISLSCLLHVYKKAELLLNHCMFPNLLCASKRHDKWL